MTGSMKVHGQALMSLVEPTRKKVGLFVSGRATLQRGSGSVRSQFHTVPLELPPFPSIPTLLISYNHCSTHSILEQLSDNSDDD